MKHKVVAEDGRVHVAPRVGAFFVLPKELTVVGSNGHRSRVQLMNVHPVARPLSEDRRAIGCPLTLGQGTLPDDGSGPLVEGHDGSLVPSWSANELVAIHEWKIAEAPRPGFSLEIRDVMFAPQFLACGGFHANQVPLDSERIHALPINGRTALAEPIHAWIAFVP